MEQHDQQRRAPRPLQRMLGDAGAAMAEFALVLVILCVFIFGIISYGYLMSFRQNMTQAAAEGARAGAVAASGSEPGDAVTAVQLAIKTSWGKDCGTGGLTCTVEGPTNQLCLNDSNTAHRCVKVTLVFDYKNNPLLPDFPFLSNVMPDSMTAFSVARVS